MMTTLNEKITIFILTFITTLIGFHFASAQKFAKPNLYIKGEVEGENIANKTIKIEYYKNVVQLDPVEVADSFSLKVKNNQFRLSTYRLTDPGYIAIVLKEKNSPTEIRKLYLFFPGDSLYPHIDGSKINYTSGSNFKYQFQERFANTSYRWTFRSDSNLFARAFQFYDSIYLSYKKSLDSQRSKLRGDEYKILNLNLQCDKNIRCLDLIRRTAITEDSLLYKNVTRNGKLLVASLLQNNYEESIAKYSYNFADFQFLLQLTAIDIERSYTDRRIAPWNFNKLYQKLQNDFTGDLHDKVLVKLFAEMQNNDSTAICLNEAIKTMDTTSLSYKELKILNNKIGLNAMPYNFDLKNINGKNTKLSDFRGKAVVLDFWFTGCSGCASLHKAMVPVMEKYRNNENIAFVSINIDKDESLWRNSVDSKIYTTRDEINLNTNGLGEEHPLIKFYQFYDYPVLMIIKKDGLMLSGCPPRPSLIYKTETQKFISFLDRSLEK